MTSAMSQTRPPSDRDHPGVIAPPPLIYFGFFLLMPWYSKVDKYRPAPDRVTK